VNKIKEKKLNSIKLQIDEISNFAQSAIETDLKETSTNDSITSKEDKDDTLTLTNIIDSGVKNKNSHYNFNDIKNELVEIQNVLNNHKIILDSILAKLP
jgi:leucyl-tRNA synthetase